MSIKRASLTARSMKYQGKATRLLRDLLSLGVYVAVIQETHFVFIVDVCMLPDVYAAYGDRQDGGVSLLVKLTLDPRVDVVDAEDG